LERGSLSLGEVTPSICGAFAAMAEHLPGIEFQRDPEWGLHVCSPIRHPIGNFAWVEDVRVWQDLDLAIPDGGAFNVYLPSGDAEAPFVPGFRHVLTQRTMMADSKRRPFQAHHRVDESRTAAERKRTADFMVNLFYHSSAREIRQMIIKGIEAADNLRLFQISDGRGGT
jgi:hypothetical protein